MGERMIDWEAAQKANERFEAAYEAYKKDAIARKEHPELYENSPIGPRGIPGPVGPIFINPKKSQSQCKE